MPQISGKPLPVRPIIDAGMPKNISAVDKAKLEKKWDDAAEARRVAVENETKTPTACTRALRFELWQFGHLWNAYYFQGKKMVPLLPSPSLLSSAMGAVDDAMAQYTSR
jgi:hypothetical protein